MLLCWPQSWQGLTSDVTLWLQYSDYEQVVVEDRIEKEKARRKAELEAEQLKCAIKVTHTH